MSMFENFPYTNLHELNLDWVINEINELKEGQVLSVNGQTGDVVLYQENDVLFPAVTETHWSLVRSADGTTRGIMFGNDNKAYIVHGSTMEQIYSQTNQPPYPVTSVNGETGAVSLYTDNNGVIAFPSITDPNVDGIILGRSVNGSPVYIQINTDGTAGITGGVNTGEIYTTQKTDKNVFAIDEAGSTETGTTANDWGIVREVNSGNIGIMFRLGETPEVYLRYQDEGFSWEQLKLLTSGDIPSSSGVVSFNGQTGVVTANGSDLEISDNDTRTISQGFDALSLSDYNIKGCIAYVENTDTASQNIPSGAYVIWKNNDYTASQAISSGDTLSSTNLTALADGGIANAIKADISTLNTNIATVDSKIGNAKIIIKTNNATSYTFEGLHGLTSTSIFKHGLLIWGISNNQTNAGIAFVFVTVDNSVVIFNITGATSRTFTGSVSNDTLTITANDTMFGGVKLIWLT